MMTDLSVMDTVSLHHIEQTLLANPSFLLEEIMFRICSGNVTPANVQQ